MSQCRFSLWFSNRDFVFKARIAFDRQDGENVFLEERDRRRWLLRSAGVICGSPAAFVGLFWKTGSCYGRPSPECRSMTALAGNDEIYLECLVFNVSTSFSKPANQQEAQRSNILHSFGGTLFWEYCFS